METRTYKVYSFDELTKEQQKEAIENYRDIEVDGRWYEDVYITWQDKLEELGYTDIKIMFSGFWSQGDGACFTASIDMHKWLKAHKLASKYAYLYHNQEYCNLKITHSNHYYYATSTSVQDTDVDMNVDDYEKLRSQLDKVVALVEKEREEIGNKIYNDLEKDYEYRTSDEIVKECLQLNDYLFTTDGKID